MIKKLKQAKNHYLSVEFQVARILNLKNVIISSFNCHSPRCNPRQDGFSKKRERKKYFQEQDIHSLSVFHRFIGPSTIVLLIKEVYMNEMASMKLNEIASLSTETYPLEVFHYLTESACNDVRDFQ